MTQCIGQLTFANLHGKQVVGAFDGGEISSDGGLVLIAQADRRLELTRKLAACVRDERQQSKVRHTVAELLAQRVYQIAAGYEDCNDADDMRRDPVLKTAIGRLPQTDPDCASQPTLSRFENAISARELRQMADVLVDVFFAQYAGATPERILLDFDATDDPTHGQQQFAEFHGYYDTHCYLPLIVTAQVDGGPHELLAAMLRPGRVHASAHALAVLKRLVARLRKEWPDAQIIFRADSGFAKPEIYDWCEDHRVGYLVSIAKNSTLLALAEPHMEASRTEYRLTRRKARQITDELYCAGSWRSYRRVIVKAEVMAQGDNPRFVVTNLTRPDAAALYQLYAARGDMENRIGELKNGLQMDRTSCHRFLANQFRVLLHAAAFVLFGALRKALRGTRLATAQVGTLQRQLIKLGVRVKQTARRVWLHFASSCPVQDLWPRVFERLCGSPA